MDNIRTPLGKVYVNTMKNENVMYRENMLKIIEPYTNKNIWHQKMSKN